MAACLSIGTEAPAWRWPFGRCLAPLLATSLLLGAVGCGSSGPSGSSRSSGAGTSALAGLARATGTATDTATGRVGAAITASSPNSAGGTITVYSVSPAAPAGLGLDPPTGTSTAVTVTNSAGYQTRDAAPLTVNPLVVTLAPGMPLDLTPIAAGTFTMGESGIAEPVHQVTISQNFYMGTHPVTQAQWEQVMGSNPSYFQPSGSGSRTDDPPRPVEMVSYTDITTASTGFLALLNAHATVSPTIPTGYVFRLPTEAEWEYACRAGTATSWYWGDSDAAIGTHAWYAANGGDATHPVGTLLPNAWGLYDMAGNVWEWCQDWYGTYDGGPGTDPVGTAGDSYRVTRGGSWISSSGCCRSAYRNGNDPDSCGNYLGFRVVLAAPRNP